MTDQLQGTGNSGNQPIFPISGTGSGSNNSPIFGTAPYIGSETDKGWGLLLTQQAKNARNQGIGAILKYCSIGFAVGIVVGIVIGIALCEFHIVQLSSTIG